MKVRQNSHGNWVAIVDGRVVALEATLPKLLSVVSPTTGDDLPTPFYEGVLANGGRAALMRAARASMDRAESGV
jgi:hypothetical protein